jgi:O-antigen/teichoic acid export membrane protein
LIVGVVLGVLFAVASPWIGTFFSVPAQFVVAVATGMPVALALPLLMGELQGQQRFLSFASINVGQAALKLVAAVAFGLILGPIGVVLGLAAAAYISYFIALYLVQERLAWSPIQPWLRPALQYLALVLPGTLALSLLLSADILLVKHFFSGRAAGEYSAVAALGRAIFWAAGGVAAVLFPKVIFRESQGNSGARIVGGSLGLVLVGGVAGFVVLGLVARPILTAFAGSAYAGGAAILPLYAISMTLFGCATVLIVTHQSRARALFLAVLLPIAAAEPLLIMAFHGSLRQVVQVVVLCMAGLVLGLAALYIVDIRLQNVPPRSRDRFPPEALTLSVSRDASVPRPVEAQL